jgi:GNAT superfamily N-acetyltransferase
VRFFALDAENCKKRRIFVTLKILLLQRDCAKNRLVIKKLCPTNSNFYMETQTTPQTIIYRPATASDVPFIAQLHTKSWLQNYRGTFSDAFLDGDLLQDRLNVWTARLTQNPENQYIVVAEDKAGLCGFACAYFNENPVFGTLLDNLHVASDRQGSSIGITLMQKIAAITHQKLPNSPLYLWVLEPNHKARAFYEKFGATNFETLTGKDPIGHPLQQCRYIWHDASSLL